MASARARVIRGRLVVDEPTDLPEGTEVELTVAGDSEDELVRVNVALDEAVTDLYAGDQGIDAFAFVAELRARR
jgi:hypothetical protein